MQYVSKPNCIILAVTAANTDLANSDAIALASAVDPEGRRTLGVLTKLDLMDRGTDAASILSGTSLDMPQLALGYIGVVNRSQADINSAQQLANARLAEAAFFAGHAAYVPLSGKGVLGTEQLVERCVSLLLKHIRRALPSLGGEIGRVLGVKRELLDQMDAVHNNDARERLRTTALTEWGGGFASLVQGRVSPGPPLSPPSSPSSPPPPHLALSPSLPSPSPSLPLASPISTSPLPIPIPS